MRGFLDRLYHLSGVVSAVLLGLIALIVVVQVAFNTVDRAIGLLGSEPPGFVIPSYADMAGFLVAGATFFALTYAFRGGAHIRVTLFIQTLTTPQRQAFALWTIFGAGLLSAFGSYYAGQLVWDSYRFNDVSPGIVGIPLWVPQLALFLGLLTFTVALIDEYVAVARGATPSFEGGETTLRSSSPDGGSEAGD